MGRAVSVEEHLKIAAERDQAIEVLHRLAEALEKGRFLPARREDRLLAGKAPS
jgi:hypothetical protein